MQGDVTRSRGSVANRTGREQGQRMGAGRATSRVFNIISGDVGADCKAHEENGTDRKKLNTEEAGPACRCEARDTVR